MTTDEWLLLYPVRLILRAVIAYRQLADAFPSMFAMKKQGDEAPIVE